MRGLASTRGFPNCAVSLSVIDQFASAINTGHQALATPLSPPLLYGPPTYTSNNLSPSIPLAAEPPSTPFVVVLCLSPSMHVHTSAQTHTRNSQHTHTHTHISLSFSAIPFYHLNLFALPLEHRGVENLDLQKSVRGRTWRSFHPLSALSSLFTPAPSLPLLPSSRCPPSHRLFYCRFQTTTVVDSALCFAFYSERNYIAVSSPLPSRE